jgi:mono/diheme cytochrome c family protein
MQQIPGVALLSVLLFSGVALSQSKDESQNPEEAVFQQHCAVCHNNPATRAPGRASLRAMSANFVVEALTSGIMKAQGSVLSPAQRVALAEYLTEQKVGAQAPMAGLQRRAAAVFVERSLFQRLGCQP